MYKFFRPFSRVGPEGTSHVDEARAPSMLMAACAALQDLFPYYQARFLPGLLSFWCPDLENSRSIIGCLFASIDRNVHDDRFYWWDPVGSHMEVCAPTGRWHLLEYVSFA